MGPASIIVTGKLETRGHTEIILPATVRDIDESRAPGIELEGSNDTGRSFKIGSRNCDNDLSARDCKREWISLRVRPIRMSPDQLTIDVKRILVIRAYDNRATGGR
jgi:hypothetical protein